MDRKKVAFRAESKRLMDELEEKKRRLHFVARTLTVPVESDEKAGGLSSMVLGVFGYERRVIRTEHIVTKQVRTHELTRQIDDFLAEAMSAFDKLVSRLTDAEATVEECIKLATDRLYDDEYAILKVAIRRSFSRIEIKSWRVRFEGFGTPAVFTNPEEINSIIERAHGEATRLFGVYCSKVNATRKKFEQEVDAITQGLSGELVKACLDRKKMEQMLSMAAMQDGSLPSDLIALPSGMSRPETYSDLLRNP